MTSNLLKNCHEIRLLTLQILKKFEVLKYEKAEDDTVEVSENFKNQPCDCINVMYEFEKTPIGFATEKNKEMHMRRLESMVKSSLMPDIYVETVYNFLIGALWIRFAPI